MKGHDLPRSMGHDLPRSMGHRVTNQRLEIWDMDLPIKD